MTFQTKSLLPAFAVMLILAGACGRPARPAKSPWLTMGTYASVSVPGQDRALLPRFSEICRSVMAKVERTLSIYDPESELSKLNAAAGESEIRVSPLTQDLLRISSNYWTLTEHMFDPTVGPLMELWGFKGDLPAEAPGPLEIATALEATGYNHVRVSKENAKLTAPGVTLDLGGIAKGYAVDLCYSALIEEGARHALINLGGNMRSLGLARPDSTGPAGLWKVGVRNPFDPDGLLGALSLENGRAVATSGNYERFVTIGTNNYAHIMDPRSGRPVQGMAGVTVLTSSAAKADVMSTALFIAGLDSAGALIRKAGDCEALLVPDRRPLEVWITPGFAEHFEPASGITPKYLH